MTREFAYHMTAAGVWLVLMYVLCDIRTNVARIAKALETRGDE